MSVIKLENPSPDSAFATVRAARSGPKHFGLRAAVLNPLETLAQSVAGVAPTATPALIVPLVFAAAGNGTWLAYTIATGCMILIAISINQFASRSSSPGSLYTYTVQGLGARVGALAGFGMLMAYVVGTGLGCVEFTIFLNATFKSFLGFEFSSVLLIFFCLFVVAAIAYKDVKLSAELMLWLELTSMALVSLIIFSSLAHCQWHLDMTQLSLSGLSHSHFHSGIVLAIFSFIGFESAASMGAEAQSPQKTVPRAILQSVLFASIFFIISSYAIVQGFQSLGDLDKCTLPLLSIARQSGVGFAGDFVNLGATISFFAATIACLNAGARTLFYMSHQGIFPSSLANAHKHNYTPDKAIFLVALVGVAPAAVLTCMGVPLMDIVGWLGTLVTYGLIAAYLGVAVAAPLFLRRRGELNLLDIGISAATVTMLILVLLGNFYPLPPAPYNFLPLLFVAYLAASAIWYRGKNRSTFAVSHAIAAEAFQSEAIRAEAVCETAPF